MSSLPEVTSFAVSGAAAKAVAALVTNRVLASPSATTAATSSAPLHPSPPLAPPPPSPPPPPPRPPPASSFVQHVDSFVFFLVFAVASARIAKLRDEHCSTGRAAAEAFVSGAAAGVCSRLISDMFRQRKADSDSLHVGEIETAVEGNKTKAWPGSAGRRPTPAGRQRLLTSRFSWPAVENHLVLALDPALTSCFFKVLDELVKKRKGTPPHGAASAAGSKPKSAIHVAAGHAGIAATTFAVAALSKAVAATVTYPLFTADQSRQRIAKANNTAGEGAAGGDAEEQTNTKAPWQAKVNGIVGSRNRNERVLSVLRRLVGADGILALYVGWLRTVAKAALGHGITKASQGLLHGLLLKLLYALAGVLGGGALALGLSGAKSSRPPPSSSSQTPQQPEVTATGPVQQLQQQLQQRLVEQEQLRPKLLRPPVQAPISSQLPPYRTADRPQPVEPRALVRHETTTRTEATTQPFNRQLPSAPEASFVYAPPPQPARQPHWPREDDETRTISVARSRVSASQPPDATANAYRPAAVWLQPTPRVLSPAEKRRLLRMYGVVDEDKEGGGRIIVNMLSSSRRTAN